MARRNRNKAPEEMKDIVIPARRVRTEMVTLLVCFLIAMALNVLAIILYKSPVSELWTSILYVLGATAFLYAVWTALRLVAYGVKRLVKR
jgi:hypothetical protein